MFDASPAAPGFFVRLPWEYRGTRPSGMECILSLILILLETISSG